MSFSYQCKLDAYTQVRKDLTDRQKLVLRALSHLGGQATMHEVADHLYVPLNSISGRFSELEDKGKLRQVGKIKPENQKSRTIWKVVK